MYEGCLLPKLSLRFSDAVFYCGFNVFTVLLMLRTVLNLCLNCIRQIVVVVFVVPVFNYSLRAMFSVLTILLCIYTVASFRMVLCELRVFFARFWKLGNITIHEQKKGGTGITDTKISFSRIAKISKWDNLLNDLFLHWKDCLKKAKSWKVRSRLLNANCIPKSLLIDNSNHSEDSRLKITKSGVVKSRTSINNSSPTRVTRNRQLKDHEE